MTRTRLSFSFIPLLVFSSMALSQQKEGSAVDKKTVYDFTMKTIDGKDKSLADYRGDVLLVVNVASFCGYTPQSKDLEAAFEQYKPRGFRILAFPANNFGQQEPGSDKEIKDFCESKFNVTFDLFSKISVWGDDQHPLYQYLTTETPFRGDVKWNFQKYLVDRRGNVVAMFPSKVKPTDKEFVDEVETLLDQQ